MHWHGEEDAKGHKKMMLIYIYYIYIYIYKDVLKGVARMPYTNFTAWRSAQQSMREAFFYISRQVPDLQKRLAMPNNSNLFYA